MQLFSLFSLLAVSALALPFQQDQDAPHAGLNAGTSPLELNPHTERLEKRLDIAQCKRVGQTLLRIGTSTATLTFVLGGSHLAAKVCKNEGNEKCERYAGYIREAYILIFGLAAHRHGAAAESHNADAFNDQNGNAKRDGIAESDDAYASLAHALEYHGFGFDSLEAVDLSNANLEKHDSSEPKMISRSIVRNFRTGNSTGTDAALNLFSNGAATLDLAGDRGRLEAYGDGYNSAGSIEKRFGSAGFKIAFTTRKRSLLNKPHQYEMANKIAREWASRADYTNMDEYFGLVKTGHNANFYHRIIPEIRGFGLNYESVDVCGGMASFL